MVCTVSPHAPPSVTSTGSSNVMSPRRSTRNVYLPVDNAAW